MKGDLAEGRLAAGPGTGGEQVSAIGIPLDLPSAAAKTRERQTFHTDSADIVALLCLREARSGGLSALVSSATLYG